MTEFFILPPGATEITLPEGSSGDSFIIENKTDRPMFVRLNPSQRVKLKTIPTEPPHGNES